MGLETPAGRRRDHDEDRRSSSGYRWQLQYGLGPDVDQAGNVGPALTVSKSGGR